MRALLLMLPLALLSAQLRAPLARRTLVWSDEFEGAAGSKPDPAKWTYDLGTGTNGWGNQELEVYTDRPENVSLDGNGHLAIRALRDANGRYTSARLKTQGLFESQHGKIEARMRLPFGQGIWPAFWMLGADIGQVGWPRCGEIDIMEHIGKEPSIVHGTLHGPGYSGGSGIGTQTSLANGARFTDGFHDFAVEWSPAGIEFFLDGQSYGRVTPSSLRPGAQWAFDHPFFLLINLAVGGVWPGYPDATTTFPQTLLVDWVRVWELPRR
jgi:beta-glucanase (GH16 family)